MSLDHFRRHAAEESTRDEIRIRHREFYDHPEFVPPPIPSTNYGAAAILRRGFELSKRFAACPNGTRMCLDAAATEAESKEAREKVADNSSWNGEKHFGENKS